MSEPKLPVKATPPEDRQLIESVKEADRITKYDGGQHQKKPVRSDFGKQWLYILIGFSILIFVAAFSWSMVVSYRVGDDADRNMDPGIGPRITDAISVDEAIPIGVESTQNNVTLRINSVMPRSRYTVLDIAVINQSTNPVSFLGMMEAQLIDDQGSPAAVDFQTAQPFITINPGSQVRAQVRFLSPIRKDVRRLTLVVNNVGTLQEKWYYEIPFTVR